MSYALRKRRKEKSKEDNAFHAIKSAGSDQLSVPTLAANVEGEETTTAPNAIFNIP